jgi:hypothetical protein
MTIMETRMMMNRTNIKLIALRIREVQESKAKEVHPAIEIIHHRERELIKTTIKRIV